MAFRGLQRESAAQGKAHHNVAKELTTLVADPFEDWALRYKVCSRAVLFVLRSSPVGD